MKRLITGILAALLIFTGNVYAFDSNYVGLGAALHRPLYADPFNWEAQANVLIAAGVKWARIGADWRSFQPDARGEYNTDLLGKMDKIVNKLYENGIQMLFGLGYSPKWVSTHPDDSKYYFYPPSDLTAWEEYVTFMTNRYKGKITAWEVWNEPDYDSFWKGTVEDYYALLQAGYSKIKETDPDNLVVMGGLTVSKRNAQNQTELSGDWFDALLRLGGGYYFDIINYHAYVDSRQMDTKYQILMEVVNRYPELTGKKIWVTETGASSYVGKDENGAIITDETSKAEFLEQTYAQHKRYDNIERIFIYTFTNPTNNTDKENEFGLVTAEGEPLDAYYHFQALGGAQLDLSGNQDPMWQTLTYDASNVSGTDGSEIKLENQAMYLRTGGTLGLRINDNWIYDANGGLDERAYVDIDYAAGQKGAAWMVYYDGQAGNEMPSATFTIPDNRAGTGTLLLEDVKFANRTAGENDLKLRVVSGPLEITGVTVRKETGRAACVLGETNRESMMTLKTESNTAGNGYTQPAVKGGLECRSIGEAGTSDDIKTANNKKGFYFDVSHGVAQPGDTQLTVEIEYFDEGTDLLAFGYNNPEKVVDIRKTGTNTWKTATFTITDADFADNKSYNADFRITAANDGSMEYIRKVTVTCHPAYTISAGYEQVGGSHVGVVTFQNQYEAQPKRAIAALGLFEGDRMVNVQYQNVTIAPGTQSKTVLLQPEAELLEGQHWRLFVWDENMQPLAVPAVIDG